MRSRMLIAQSASMFITTVLLAGPSLAQTVPSAGQQAAQSAQGNGSPQSQPTVGPTHAWELPALLVPGEAKPQLREEDRIGTYGQPRWTASRRFPTTRVYVIPEGKAEVEWWMRYSFPVANATSQREVRNYYEVGYGLGHRLQFDFYVVTEQKGHGENAKIELLREQVELRYALADWGKLWGNPTLYVEWQRRNGGHDWVEGKVLIGGGLGPGWHGGTESGARKGAWRSRVGARVSGDHRSEQDHCGRDLPPGGGGLRGGA